ncbi:TolC family protein [bacterium]|nr:TolC family protein [bacterium]
MRLDKTGAESPAPPVNGAPRAADSRNWLLWDARLLGLAVLVVMLAGQPVQADDAVDVLPSQPPAAGADPDSTDGAEETQDESSAEGYDAQRLLLADAGQPAAGDDVPLLQPLDSSMDLRPRFDPALPSLPSGHEELISYIIEGYDNPDQALSLHAALELALAHNHSLNSQRLRAAAATKEKQIVWADLRPQIGMQAQASQQWTLDRKTTALPGGGSTSADVTGDPTLSVALEVTKRIYDWGLSSRLVDSAEARHAIEYYSTGIAEDQLIYDVIFAYYGYNLALGQLRVRRDELDLAVEFLRIAQIQFEVGTVPRLDVIRAEARVEQARDSLIQAQASLGNSAALFFSLLGAEDQRYVPAVITPDLVDLGPEPLELQQAIDNALVGRPEVELQYQTLFAGEVSRELARNRPLLDAYAQGQLLAPHTQQAGYQSYEVGLQLVWQLSTGGKDRIQREQADLNLRSIEESIHDLEARIEFDATTAWNSVVANRGSADAARKNLELTAEALRAANVGYRAGVTPYIEFESALNANIAAAIGYLTALVNVQVAQANLERAQGFPAYDAALAGLADDASNEALPDTSSLHKRLEAEDGKQAAMADSPAAAPAEADAAPEETAQSASEGSEPASSSEGETWADAGSTEADGA